MSRFLSGRYKGLLPYSPGEQPQNTKYVKLNTNESPFQPTEKILKSINSDELKKLRLYSDPEAKQSTQAIAKYYNLSANEVMVTNGSDEALMFILMAFCDNENGIAFPNITYGFYSVFCELLSLNSTLIPLKSDYKLDVDAFVGLNKNIIIANPNAPTGIAIAINDVRKILQSNPNNIVAIDEAYVDFGAQSAVELIKEFDNLIVVQTFSKSRSLAGARLGMALSNSDIICDLNKIRFSFNPYNVNRLTDLMGKLAIEDNDYFKNCCDVIVENREYTTASLISLGFEVLPSSANFIFARKAKLSGEIFYLKLKEKGILVRYFDKPLLSDFVRISIGSRKEMEFVIKKTIEILKEECLL